MPTCPNCQAYVPIGEKQCPSCGLEADFEEIAREERAKRDMELDLGVTETEKRLAEAREALERIQVTTLDLVLGCRLAADLGVIGVDVVGYVGLFDSDIEKKLGEMREASIRKLREKALTMGGDAVVAVGSSVASINASSLGFILSATGTVVTLAFEEARQG